MDPDPMGYVEDDGQESEQAKEANKARSKLNTMVAITVALLATFLGIGKVKDDNIVQAMQQAQADKIDNYTWYQARNVREDIAKSTVAQLTAQAATVSPEARKVYDEQIAKFQAVEKNEADKKQKQLDDAAAADKNYNDLNFHDDQFDLSDAMLALAISLLAVTALTQKRWLFYLALVPTVFGVLMGLAGLFGWNIHPDAFTKLLS
jgi:ribosomal protein S13